jgi:hypothetical protein
MPNRENIANPRATPRFCRDDAALSVVNEELSSARNPARQRHRTGLHADCGEMGCHARLQTMPSGRGRLSRDDELRRRHGGDVLLRLTASCTKSESAGRLYAIVIAMF